MVKKYYILRYLYQKLRQKMIPNCGKKVLKLASKTYYKLRQLEFPRIINDYYKSR